MPREVNILKVLVSSPSDVNDERIRLESIVDEVNKTIGSSSGTKLELVKWETDVNPGVGKYPQDVINKQIGDDYEIFIGVLWKKFGTPTSAARSGTEEEFNRAYERCTMYPDSVHIMFYFKEESINPYEIDSEQFDLIKGFRNNLGGKGVLWDAYSNIDDFEKKVRMHLHKEVRFFDDARKETILGKVENPVIGNKIDIKEISGNLPSWKLLYEHDENGNQVEGNIESLIDAVIKGCPIRIRIHHSNKNIQVMDAPLLSIESQVVYASDINQISKTKDEFGNYIYPDKPYHYYVIAGSNGHFHAKRIFFDGKERNTTNSKRHIAWIGLMPPNS